MNFVKTDLKISDTSNIQTTPISLFRLNSKSNEYLISDFVINGEKRRKNGIYLVLKPRDTIFILNQNKRLLKGFKWDLSKLGYTNNNNPKKIYFSLPYFTKNLDSVIFYKSYDNTSAFMAGGSSIYFYEKSKNGWKRTLIKMSLN